MTTGEKKIAAQMLDAYSDELGNHGCNDYSLDDTPENRVMMEAAERWNSKETPTLHIRNGKILTSDFFVAAYLGHLLEEEVKNG